MEDISLATAWVSFLFVFFTFLSLIFFIFFFFFCLRLVRWFFFPLFSLFVLWPMCRQTVGTQRGKDTENESGAKQCPRASDNIENKKKADASGDRMARFFPSQFSNEKEKTRIETHWVRKVKAADVIDDGRWRPLMISCHNFLLMTSTSPPRATTKLYSS